MIATGCKVKIVDDVGKSDSALIGKVGVVTSFKWNKFRQENNLPVVLLEDGSTVCGWSLWFEVLN